MILNVNSELIYCGDKFLSKNGWTPELQEKADQIDDYIQTLELERARNAIYNLYGTCSIDTQKNLLRIVQKIVELNEGALSENLEQLNYTLEAAYSMGCTLYQKAFQKAHDKETNAREFMPFAIEAITLVAEAQAKKGNFYQALHYAARLDPYNSLKDKLWKRWKNYIENDCPPEARSEQERLYAWRKIY